jgi:hypothetical protein
MVRATVRQAPGLLCHNCGSCCAAQLWHSRHSAVPKVIHPFFTYQSRATVPPTRSQTRLMGNYIAVKMTQRQAAVAAAESARQFDCAQATNLNSLLGLFKHHRLQTSNNPLRESRRPAATSTATKHTTTASIIITLHQAIASTPSVPRFIKAAPEETGSTNQRERNKTGDCSEKQPHAVKQPH